MQYLSYFPRRQLLLPLILLMWPSLTGAIPNRVQRFKTDRARAGQTLQSLKKNNAVTIEWPAHRSRPSFITGLNVFIPGQTHVERAHRFLKQYPNLFVDNSCELKHVQSQMTYTQTVVRFQQVYHGLNVEGGTLAVSIDTSGSIQSVTSEVEPVRLDSTHPKITATNALKIAYRGTAGRDPSNTELASLPSSWASLVILNEGIPLLIYKVFLPLEVDSQGRFHLVDALSGQYLGWRPGVISEKIGSRGGVRP